VAGRQGSSVVRNRRVYSYLVLLDLVKKGGALSTRSYEFVTQLGFKVELNYVSWEPNCVALWPPKLRCLNLSCVIANPGVGKDEFASSLVRSDNGCIRMTSLI
jgi:hypothetical protein